MSRETDQGAISRVPALDGVRGVAILLVLALHFGVNAPLPQADPFGIGRWLQRVFYVGWIGVDLFFVLSGFLITNILLVSKGQPHYFSSFYGRRALRIFPLSYTALALGVLVLPLVVRGIPLDLGQAREKQIWLWTYTVNLAFSFGWLTTVGLFNHFWTLAIEEQYYLVWPWLVRYTSRRALLVVCGVLIVQALIVRIAWMNVRHDWVGAYEFTFARIDALAAGGLIAVLIQENRWRARLFRIAPIGLTIGLLLIAAIFFRVPRFYPSEWIVVTFGHSLLAATFGFFLLLAIRESGPEWLSARPLRSLGKISYGLYVWHFPVQLILSAAIVAHPAAAFANGFAGAAIFMATGVAASFALSWCSYRAIEQPFLRLKRFFPYERVAGRAENAGAPVAQPL